MAPHRWWFAALEELCAATGFVQGVHQAAGPACLCMPCRSEYPVCRVEESDDDKY